MRGLLMRRGRHLMLSEPPGFSTDIATVVTAFR
jgi:hypothetical protein